MTSVTGRMIGNADEFWRVRMTRVDTTDDFDFEWHDDILYRSPRPGSATELELWIVEAVSTENYETVIPLATYAERDEAEAFFERARYDLEQMTKSQFETAYLPSDETDTVEASSDEA